MRKKEVGFSIIAFISLLLGFFLAGFANKTLGLLNIDFFFLAVILAAVFFLSSASIKILASKADYHLLPLAFLLSGIGLILIFRLNSPQASSQLLWIAIGLSLMIVTMLIFNDYEILKQYKYLAGVTGIIFLVLPIFFGVVRGGSKLWLDFGFLKFQPSEIAKVLLVIFFAGYLAEKKEMLSISKKEKLFLPSMKHLGPLLIMWTISLVVLIFEKDLGTSLLFFGLFVAMIYIATGRFSYVFFGLILFLAGASLTYLALHHVQIRVNVWLNPWTDVKGNGYQIIQSLFAIASGGLTGVGLGNGHPSLIPAVQTDFIFSAFAEEIGLYGSVALLVTYLLFIYQSFKISLKTQDEFSKLLASGLAFIFGFQTFLIIAGVTKLVPLTGVTLPFISYGGSSIIANFIILGILLIISNKNNESELVKIG